MSSFIHSSVGHCWSIFTTETMYLVIFSVRRFCAKRCWSTISSRIMSSGRGMSLQRRTKPGIPRWPEGVERFFSLFQAEEMVVWSLSWFAASWPRLRTLSDAYRDDATCFSRRDRSFSIWIWLSSLATLWSLTRNQHDINRRKGSRDIVCL